jgi:hypothetical protein
VRGRPAPMSASTSTIRPSSPTKATDHAQAAATQPTALTWVIDGSWPAANTTPMASNLMADALT